MRDLRTYHVKCGDTEIYVRARAYSEAARYAGKELFGADATRRVTGVSGMSGCFRAYNVMPDGALSSVGNLFNLRECE